VRPEAAPPIRVLTAERAGGPGPSQDRILVLPNAVAVLDGASGTTRGDQDGGWYADQLVTVLTPLLPDESRPLPDLLRQAIAEVTETHQLVPGESPSSTVAIVRWNADEVDALVLGDTAVIAFPADGSDPEVIDDQRLSTVATEERAAYKADLSAGHGYGARHEDNLRRLVAAERHTRNTGPGYWIAEADPTAAENALTRSWPLRTVRAVLLATDGATRGVDRYSRPRSWTEALALIEALSPEALISAVHDAEDEDPAGIRWPRSKPHDDQAVAAVLFNSDRRV
jgi:hypothetical protein